MSSLTISTRPTKSQTSARPLSPLSASLPPLAAVSSSLSSASSSSSSASSSSMLHTMRPLNNHSYQLNSIGDSSELCSFDTEQFNNHHHHHHHQQQQQHPHHQSNGLLPAPHLLIQSNMDHICSPSSCSTSSIASLSCANSISSCTTIQSPISTSSSTPTPVSSASAPSANCLEGRSALDLHASLQYSMMINYPNSQIPINNGTMGVDHHHQHHHQQQQQQQQPSVNIKHPNYIHYSQNGSSRSNYGYLRPNGMITSLNFDNIADPISFNTNATSNNSNNNNNSNSNNNNNSSNTTNNTNPNAIRLNDSMNYQLITDGAFNNWNSNSMSHDLKLDSQPDGYQSHLMINDTSATDDFGILASPNESNRSNVYGSMNRCPSTVCPPNNPQLDETSTIHLNQNAGPMTTHPMQHQYDALSMNYRSTYDVSSIGCGLDNPTRMEVVKTSVPINARNGSNPCHAKKLSTTQSPLASTITMTPDSSTTGFTANKFGCSSDDGEASPTPTCSSECPQTPGRSRKPAPTLATGRRNLKGELVDPDEADRRMKRRERNRKSAQKCRERKVQRTQELQSQVECLQMEASRLVQELNGWRAQARQCVALLQHHCPNVAIPYLSCLNEQMPSGLPPCSLTNFKEPMDALMDITSLDRTNTYDDLDMGWKSRQNRKPPYSNVTNDNAINGGGGPMLESNIKDMTNGHSNNNSNNGNSNNNNHFVSNESTVILPSVNLLRSSVTPNRSKSLFGFASSNTDKDCTVTHSYPPISETPTLSTLNEGADLSTSMILSMTRSTSVVSMPGPASGSSSSSCSTYELSFPFSESHTRGLHETMSPFKDQSDQSGLIPILNGGSSHNRTRMMSGQDILDTSTNNNDLRKLSSNHIQHHNNKTNPNNNQLHLWELDYQDSENKNAMDCSAITSTNSNMNCATLMGIQNP